MTLICEKKKFGKSTVYSCRTHVCKINDLLLWIENAELHNFADDNTISCTEKSLEKLIKTSESEKLVQWFKGSKMIENPDKFLAVIIDRKNQQNNHTSIKINDINTNSKHSLRLLRLEIDSMLNFEKYITQLLCKKVPVS